MSSPRSPRGQERPGQSAAAYKDWFSHIECPRTPFSGSGADWRTAVRTAVRRNARRRSAAVSAYGEGRRDVAAKRDPPRRFVRDNIGALIDPIGRFEYIALYDMNFTTTARRAAFLKRVTRVFKAW